MKTEERINTAVIKVSSCQREVRDLAPVGFKSKVLEVQDFKILKHVLSQDPGVFNSFVLYSELVVIDFFNKTAPNRAPNLRAI